MIANGQPGETSDAECVQKARAGDACAFEELAMRYQPLVTAYTQHLLEGVPDAEDVAQEAFLRAFRELGSLREPDRFGAWLKSIAWRECRAWVRERQAARRAAQQMIRDRLASGASSDPDAALLEDDPGDDPWLERLAQTLDSLSEGKKAVLSLFYIQGLRHEQIAGFLDIPVGTVKRRLFEARQAVTAATETIGPADLAERRRFVEALKRLLSAGTGSPS